METRKSYEPTGKLYYKEPAGAVYYPEYWAKRRNKLNPNLVSELEKSAESEVVDADEHGVYKVGTFLFRNAIVTVRKDEKAGWSLHIFSEYNIGLPLIKEARYRYIPNGAVMCQLFPSREEDGKMQGVMLYEIPRMKAKESEE